MIGRLVDLSTNERKEEDTDMEERFETFTVLIARINRGIKRIKAEEMAEFGLKGPHVSCLYYLSCCGEMTAAELCERCDEDKAAISRSLDDLEKNGYITWRKRSGQALQKSSPPDGKGENSRLCDQREDHTHRRRCVRGAERGGTADDVPCTFAHQRQSGEHLHRKKRRAALPPGMRNNGGTRA